MLLKHLKIIKLCLCFFYVVSLSEAAHLSPCRVILQDPRLRDQQILENTIFSQGDVFALNNNTPDFIYRLKSFFRKYESTAHSINGNHANFFDQNKSRILSALKKQGTRLLSIRNEDFQKNIYVIQGGSSRLGRFAQKIWSLYGIKVIINFERLREFAGSYISSEKSIVIGLEDILYPNQLSYTLWHEAIHAKNDFESLIHLVITDNGDNPYPYFFLDEIIAYDKTLLHLKNSKLTSQRVEGDRKKIHPRSFDLTKILKDLSQRVIAKKPELLDLLSRLKNLEKNSKLQYQQNWTTLEFLNKYPQIKVQTSSFLKESMKTVPTGYFDLNPEYEDDFFKGTPEEFRTDFIRRTHYSINLISKALEIAEKRAIEPLQLEN